MPARRSATDSRTGPASGCRRARRNYSMACSWSMTRPWAIRGAQATVSPSGAPATPRARQLPQVPSPTSARPHAPARATRPPAPDRERAPADRPHHRRQGRARIARRCRLNHRHRDAQHRPAHHIANLEVRTRRIAMIVMAGDTGRRDGRIGVARREVPGAAQRLVGIVVLAGVVGDELQAGLLRLGARRVLVVDRPQRLQRVGEASRLVLGHPLGDEAEHLGRQRIPISVPS